MVPVALTVATALALDAHDTVRPDKELPLASFGVAVTVVVLNPALSVTPTRRFAEAGDTATLDTAVVPPPPGPPGPTASPPPPPHPAARISKTNPLGFAKRRRKTAERIVDFPGIFGSVGEMFFVSRCLMPASTGPPRRRGGSRSRGRSQNSKSKNRPKPVTRLTGPIFTGQRTLTFAP